MEKNDIYSHLIHLFKTEITPDRGVTLYASKEFMTYVENEIKDGNFFMGQFADIKHSAMLPYKNSDGTEITAILMTDIGNSEIRYRILQK